MLERPMSLKSGSSPQPSRNRNYCRALLKRSPGPCQENLESMTFWQRMADSSRNWLPDGSSPQTSSTVQKKPMRAMAQPQTEALLLKRPASLDRWAWLVGIDAQRFLVLVHVVHAHLVVHQKLMPT